MPYVLDWRFQLLMKASTLKYPMKFMVYKCFKQPHRAWLNLDINMTTDGVCSLYVS